MLCLLLVLVVLYGMVCWVVFGYMLYYIKVFDITYKIIDTIEKYNHGYNSNRTTWHIYKQPNIRHNNK